MDEYVIYWYSKFFRCTEYLKEYGRFLKLTGKIEEAKKMPFKKATIICDALNDTHELMNGDGDRPYYITNKKRGTKN